MLCSVLSDLIYGRARIEHSFNYRARLIYGRKGGYAAACVSGAATEKALSALDGEGSICDAAPPSGAQGAPRRASRVGCECRILIYGDALAHM